MYISCHIMAQFNMHTYVQTHVDTLQVLCKGHNSTLLVWTSLISGLYLTSLSNMSCILGDAF
jgi:hypothetical protein